MKIINMSPSCVLWPILIRILQSYMQAFQYYRQSPKQWSRCFEALRPHGCHLYLPLSSFFLASPGSTWTSWRMRGRRVTMPVPRGSRSLPTRLSSTELFPLLWRHKIQIERGVRLRMQVGLWVYFLI